MVGRVTRSQSRKATEPPAKKEEKAKVDPPKKKAKEVKPTPKKEAKKPVKTTPKKEIKTVAPPEKHSLEEKVVSKTVEIEACKQ